MLLLPVWLACAPPPAPPAARAVAGGVEVDATVPLDRVTVSDAAGAPIATRRMAAPGETVAVAMRWRPGDLYTAEVVAGEQHWTVPVAVPTEAGPVSLQLSAPQGQAE